MQGKKTMITWLLASSACLVLNSGSCQGAYGQTTDQYRRFKDAGIPVVLPQYLPPGFQMSEFKVGLIYDKNRISYDAIYKGPNSCSFQVNGSLGGWGSAGDIVRRWTINSSLLGEIVLEELSFARSGGGTSLSAWAIPDSDIPGSGRLTSRGFPYAGYLLNFECKNGTFSPREASKIIYSLQMK